MQSNLPKKSRTLRHLSCLLVLVICAAHVSAQSVEPVDTVRVDSDLVNLTVSVINRDPAKAPIMLQQNDFQVFEDGSPQTISFFATADTPFDLVLLLDLSGSLSQKIGLIRRSAKRFVDATRPTDRVGVVTFTDQPKVASQLTFDRRELKNSIDHIERPVGGTNFWDALRFVLENSFSDSTSRRTAVVVMTDGVDNALPDVFGEGSQTSFADLLSIIRHSETLVFPVYVDTEKEEAKIHRTPHSGYEIARTQLDEIAAASGALVFKAGRLKDLDATYEKVTKDLSTVYTIGYQPSNSTKDGKWRAVAIKLPAQPDLAVRARAGYFAGSDRQSVRK